MELSPLKWSYFILECITFIIDVIQYRKAERQGKLVIGYIQRVVKPPVFFALQLYDESLNVVIVRGKTLCVGWGQVSDEIINTNTRFRTVF